MLTKVVHKVANKSPPLRYEFGKHTMIGIGGSLEITQQLTFIMIKSGKKGPEQKKVLTLDFYKSHV